MSKNLMGESLPDWGKQPEIHSTSSFKFPVIEEFKLENGIPMTVIHDERQDAFRLDVVIGSGQVDQAKLLQASTTCRMLREGTSHYSSNQIAEKLDYYGAWLETSTYFLYSRITLYSLTKYADKTIPLVAEIIRNAVFPEHEFEIVNNSNKAYSQVIAAKSNVKAQRTLLTCLFGKQHICGRFATVDDYEQLRVQDLHCFYKTFYSSSNCRLFFSGRLTDKLHQQITSAFGADKWGNCDTLPVRKTQVKHTVSQKRVFTECSTACQSSVRLGCFLMPCTDKDFLLSNFFNTLLGGFFGSRLMTELREKRGFTYGISSTVSLYPFDTLLLISSETSAEHIEDLISGVYQQIERLQQERVGEQELSLVRNYFISDICRTYEEPFSVADYCINMKLFGLPYDTQAKAVRLATDCSADDIREFACKWLHPVDFRESVSGKSV